MDKYIPLSATGFIEARRSGYIAQNDPANGNLCLQCGAVVASRVLHDNWHWFAEDEEDDEGN